jgi:membrane protein YqaA with SNARE-associated domain
MGSLVALFGWSFLAATVVPVGSEPLLVGMLLGDGNPWLLVAIATAGNFLGAATLYWMGRRAGQVAEARWGRGRFGGRAAGLLRRWGGPALVFAWAPLIGDVLVALAGASGISFASFTPWVLAGKATRYAVVAWLVCSV